MPRVKSLSIHVQPQRNKVRCKISDVEREKERLLFKQKYSSSESMELKEVENRLNDLKVKVRPEWPSMGCVTDKVRIYVYECLRPFRILTVHPSC